ALIVGGWSLAALLILPVRGDALFGDAVHLFGPDLHFERLAVRAYDAGVQRLIEIRTRNGDEVFDASRNRAPLVVDDAKGRVAVLDRIRDDAERHQIVDLIDCDLLPAQFLENGVRTLHAAINARRNAFAPQLGFDGLAHFFEKLFVGMPLRFDLAHDLFIGIGLEVLKGEVFELATDFAHSQAVGNGRVDLYGLAGDPFAPFGAEVAERAHVVDAVGKLDHDDADIFHHGEQHFAEAFRLP